MDEQETKWNVKNNKIGYLKIHLGTVDVKSKKILSMKVFDDDEHVHDNIRVLP